MDCPPDLLYTEEHEWVRVGDGVARIGVTHYAQDQLGDIVFVDLPEVGATIDAGVVMAEIESTKSVGEVYAPFSGTVKAVNETVGDQPELVNQDPYGEGWLVDLEPVNGIPEGLLDADAYRALIE